MAGDPGRIDGLEVPTRAVDDAGGLMHHKYVVRDGDAVWTGSLNWTDDAFSLEENVAIAVRSDAVAAAFVRNFEELWRRRRIDRTGAIGTRITLAGGVEAQAFFSPAPPFLGHLAAGRIVTADRRLKVVSPVITSGAVLGTLCEHVARRRLDVGGAYDATQMREVERQWAALAHNRWKIEAWRTIAPHLSGKPSTPFRPGSARDYMHAKVVVVDDEVLVGSYNLSKHGEANAENVLHLRSEPLAERFAGFVDAIAERYAGVDVGGATAPS
jgi:phosphatidylserine/phosphatidylglycerophosphate/cardiolipin synthase-like enzyme